MGLVVDDLLEALTAPCADCGKSGGDSQVTFAAAWLAYLCVSCRAMRNDVALRKPPVPIAERSVYPSVVAMDAAFLDAASEVQERSGERESQS
jgi:hypothetical protein